MTVKEMVEILSEFPDGAELRLAIQPRWAFQHHISDVVQGEYSRSDCEDCSGEELVECAACNGYGQEMENMEKHSRTNPAGDEKRCKACNGTGEIPCRYCDTPKDTVDTVWIGEGSQVYDKPYLPIEAARALGWK